MNKEFAYMDGVIAMAGDRICVAGKRGFIDKVILPLTEEAKDFRCFDSGGLLLKFEDGDLQLWSDLDEDLTLERRG